MSPLTDVITIVPRLSPAIDGVGDYSLHLAQALRSQHHINTHFIVCDPNWHGASHLNGFAVHQLPQRSSLTLIQSLEKLHLPNAPILLQFSGYGYAKWACPLWLVDGLEHWKDKHPQSPLLIMFHELYNSLGLPWEHNFWTYFPQLNIAQRLARLCDHCIANTEQYGRRLTQLSCNKHPNPQCLPVISNVGEPRSILPLSDRVRRMVVFGQKGTRARAYQAGYDRLAQACRLLKITEIWDLGDPGEQAWTTIDDIPVRYQGHCSAEAISDILSRSFAAFIHYDSCRLGKSGVFAAYAAHGLVPVVQDSGEQGRNWAIGRSDTAGVSIDGLVPGQHYWKPSLPDASGSRHLAMLQSIATQAHDWYQEHCLSVQAEMFYQQLCDRTGSPPPFTPSLLSHRSATRSTL